VSSTSEALLGPAAAPDRPAEEPETALAHATERVPTGRTDDTAEAARAGLIGASFAFAGVVVLLDAGGGLAGIVPLERLLAAPPDTRLAELADHDAPVVAPGAEQEAVARAAQSTAAPWRSSTSAGDSSPSSRRPRCSVS
jgi:hypothetical protein